MIEISKLAQYEIEDSKEYYNLQQDGLGDRFKEHIRESVDKIDNSPTLYPKITDELHRVVLHKFPYNIFYAIEYNRIIIISVAHQYRKPFYEI